jgi:UDP-N-acetylglucosamine:LPS N-acetylglucosamine transferase
VALPAEIYAYPAHKTKTVGVPVAAEYQPVGESEMIEARGRVGINAQAEVVVVATGGLGARRVNDAVLAIAPRLLAQRQRLQLVHQVGRTNEEAMNSAYDDVLPASDRDRVKVMGFVSNMHDYSAAADVVVARAGGTNLAELAMQGKACIVIPNPYLTGGHQLKNAQVLADIGAAIIVEESALTNGAGALLQVVIELLDDTQRCMKLGKALLATVSSPHSARELATVLLEVASSR